MKSAKKNLKRVGLIPAGGQAERLGSLPCSKEIYPIGFYSIGSGIKQQPKVACQNLLESMQVARVDEVFVILRKGKWDIPEYLGDGKRFGTPIGYLIMDLPYGAPFTLNQAYPFVKDALIIFGFPDILFKPTDSLKLLVAKQNETDAEIVLGLFRADNPRKMDMVEVAQGGRVKRIEIKPAATHLEYTWIIAVWTPKFTEFIHDFVTSVKKKELRVENMNSGKKYKEFYVGHVLQEAINAGLFIDSIVFEKGKYIDIGTPEDLKGAVISEN